MTTILIGQRGTCAHCGHAGFLTGYGRPQPHGTLRRTVRGIVVVPGVCPGVAQAAENATLLGRPVAAFFADLDATSKPGPATADPLDDHVSRTMGDLLVRIGRGHVYRNDDGSLPTTGRSLELACLRGWVTESPTGEFELIAPAGHEAAARHRANRRGAIGAAS